MHIVLLAGQSKQPTPQTDYLGIKRKDNLMPRKSMKQQLEEQQAELEAQKQEEFGDVLATQLECIRRGLAKAKAVVASHDSVYAIYTEAQHIHDLLQDNLTDMKRGNTPLRDMIREQKRLKDEHDGAGIPEGHELRGYEAQLGYWISLSIEAGFVEAANQRDFPWEFCLKVAEYHKALDKSSSQATPPQIPQSVLVAFGQKGQ